MDTPAYRLAANFSGWRVRPSTPLMPPERVARAIVRCAEKPRAEVIVGTSVRILELTHALAPTLTERTVARGIGSVMLGEESDAPSAGNLFEPRPA